MSQQQKPDYRQIAERLGELFSMSAHEVEFTGDQREFLEYSIAVMADLDPWFVEQAGFRDGELVSMFQRVSEAHNRVVKELAAIKGTYGSDFTELKSGTYKDVEMHKAELSVTRDNLQRLSGSIVERAKIRAANPGMNR